MKASTKEVGDIGEDIAAAFLGKKGHKLLGRNYWRKWGEIDIISEKEGKIHFVEVKTHSREASGYRPEERVHPKKLERLHRAIQSYLLEKNIEGEWQIDVIAVTLHKETKEAHVKHLENVIL